jgi:glycine/D-amino acid oxidase-like deaminating enzyme
MYPPRRMTRIAVIGAGAFGGWIALQLRRRGAEVVLVDGHGPGNSRSSSGGETRVIRAVYGPDRIYVELVKRAYELWEELQATAGEQLYVETGTLWFQRDDQSYISSSAPILRELGFPIDELSIGDARRRYPQVDFSGVRSVWLEHRAGALSARRACVAVRDAFIKAGGTYRIQHVDPNALTFDADAYVFACGPWLGQLFPEVLGEWIKPTRQEVYFFGTPPGSDRYLPSNMPIWLDFGERIFYGIPDTHGRGFKIADDTRGEPIDPTSAERTPSLEGIARARRLLAERFPELATAPLLEARVCQYENSPDGHLLLDRHPGADNIWFAGGGSGHGFKLSPAIGELVARAVLDGAELPRMFRLDPARIAKPATQFEAGHEVD